MNCPKCNGATTVTESISSYHAVSRRRRCKSCGNNFFTTEKVLADSPIYFSQMRFEKQWGLKHDKAKENN